MDFVLTTASLLAVGSVGYFGMLVQGSFFCELLYLCVYASDKIWYVCGAVTCTH
jgi:hypothetical protein